MQASQLRAPATHHQPSSSATASLRSKCTTLAYLATKMFAIDNFNDRSSCQLHKSLTLERCPSSASHPNSPSSSRAGAEHNLGRTVLDHTVSRSGAQTNPWFPTLSAPLVNHRLQINSSAALHWIRKTSA